MVADVPDDVLALVLTYVQYPDLPNWCVLARRWHATALPMLQTVRYPSFVHRLCKLHPRTTTVHLDAPFVGKAQNVRLVCHGHQTTGIYRRCTLENATLRDTVLIDSNVLSSEIRNSRNDLNVETNGTCHLENMCIKYNTKGLVNLGTLTMTNCTVEYNNTGLETRGKLALRDCSVRYNSVGVLTSGEVVFTTTIMQHNTVNLFQGQPNRPLQRCWTQ